MTRIIVIPEQLRSFSNQWQQTASGLHSIEGRLTNAWNGLDWEARQKAGVEGRVYQARSQANALANQAEAFARYLQSKANTFEEADRQGVNALATLPSPPFPLPVLAPRRLPWPFPQLGLVYIPSLAKRVDQILSALRLPLIGRTTIRQIDPGWVQHFPDLRHNPWKKIKNSLGLSNEPLWFFLNTGLEFLEHPEDQNLRGLEIAATKTGIELVATMEPHAALVMAANDAVQVGGWAYIQSTAGLAKAISVDPMYDRLVEQSANYAQQALEKLDLGNITRDLATLLVDTANAEFQAEYEAVVQAWRQPSVENILHLTTAFLEGPAMGATIEEDLARLGHHLMDFGAGLIEAPSAVIFHEGITISAIGKGLYDRGLLDDVALAVMSFPNPVMVISAGLYDRVTQAAFELLNPATPP